MGKPRGRKWAGAHESKRGRDRVSNERELMSQEFGGHDAQSAYDNNAMAIAVAAKRRKFSMGSLKSVSFAGTATAKV